MSDEMKAAQEALGKIESKLDKTLADHTAEIERHGKASTELTGKVDDLAQKHAETDASLRELVQKAQEGWAGGGGKEFKTIGREFVESEQMAHFKAGKSDKARLEVKNTIIGEGGSPQDPVNTIVPQDRLPGIVPGAFRALSVLDFFPAGTTGSNQIEYTRETQPSGFTNAAAERAEGTAKPESELVFELIQDPVRTIAHWLKASKQVLDDAPALETYINRRLSHGVRNRLELQILRGNGTSPNISGLAASGRHTAFAAVTGDSALQTLNRAKYSVIAADENPDVIFMNPADWGAIERDTTSEGIYVAGHGNAISYVGSGMQPLAWGLPVITSNNVESGKFYCMASMATQLFVRNGVTVEMGYVNTDFTQNLVTLLAEMRAALAVFRPDAVLYGDLTV